LPGLNGGGAAAAVPPRNQLPMHTRARETVGLFKTALMTHLHSVD